MRSRKNKRRTKRILNGLLILAGLGLVFLAGVLSYKYFIETNQPPEKQVYAKVDHKLVVIPSLYMTGSSGDTTKNIDRLIKAIDQSDNNPAKPGLKILVDPTDGYKVNVTGKIEKGNLYPMIALGMTKGTNDPKLYEYSIKAAMDYLVAHYDMPHVNMLGYSTGAAGVLRYLMNYSNDKELPKVGKFVSLDGMFNDRYAAEPGESLKDILKNGPKQRSPEYSYWAENSEKFPKDTQTLLLSAKHPGSKESDNFVPWADSFSTYHFFKKKGGPVSFEVFGGSEYNTNHGKVCENPQAQGIIERFFYS
ncbi:alpha/beta hydrolase [Lactococcus termiticola]|uniref:Alpha/beta hydrolase n=1 Tax=Lactococcus termiticola TaxID=2169526 RepID=A0A2R5HK41_9LACT|nr:alpha/beta hydrolase [Lactococcus termiticola]GBG97120.1 alpha/beta hydrolase [Lactococcus termiticola]